MKAEELKNIIVNDYNSRFADGMVDVRIINRFGKSIWFDVYADRKINVTRMNDMLSTSLEIVLPNNFDFADDLPESLTLEVVHNRYFRKPTKEYYAYSQGKFNIRKTTGNVSKIISTMDKYFDRIHDEITNAVNADEITDNYKQIAYNMIGKQI